MRGTLHGFIQSVFEGIQTDLLVIPATILLNVPEFLTRIKWSWPAALLPSFMEVQHLIYHKQVPAPMVSIQF